MTDRRARGDVAVMASGGLDSAVLAVELLGSFDRVFPIYVRFGLRWEGAELSGLRAFLREVARPGLAPLTVIDEPMGEVYGDHWSLGGAEVPGRDSVDASVHLPGRNLLLLAKASVWCRLRGVDTIALGTLASNPFPDSTPGFDRSLERALNEGSDGPLRVIRPFARLTKADVLRLGRGLPIGLTSSCLDPARGRPCGACNKCDERRRAFEEAGILDPTSGPESSLTASRRA